MRLEMVITEIGILWMDSSHKMVTKFIKVENIHSRETTDLEFI